MMTRNLDKANSALGTGIVIAVILVAAFGLMVSCNMKLKAMRDCQAEGHTYNMCYGMIYR
jgi:hypothetical protein